MAAAWGRLALGRTATRFSYVNGAISGSGDPLHGRKPTGGRPILVAADGHSVARGDEIPPPSKAKRGPHPIDVPLPCAEAGVYLAMRERRLPNTELAKRLGLSETVVRRVGNYRAI
jgi:hypothetical protein